jgi:ubiquinone/menaquinone biosynthesis C-methylase UbiE
VKPDRKYELASFWDERYSKRKENKHKCEDGCWHDGATDDFLASEWYYTYADIKPLLQPFLRAAAKGGKGVELLDLGCGISTFFADLAADGYKGHWVGVDFSGEAMRQMRANYPLSKYSSWEFVEADVRRMHSLQSKSFDLVVDKALSDALICDVHQGKQALERTYEEVNRLLRPGGVFVVVSLYSPDKDEDMWFIELLTECFLSEPNENTSVPLTSPPKSTSKGREKRTKRSPSSPVSSSCSVPPPALLSTSSSYPYKLKIIIHSSSEDGDEENEAGENPNWMSARYVYTVQKCRTTARNSEPYTIEHRVH